jgi:hypothetical protein
MRKFYPILSHGPSGLLIWVLIALFARPLMAQESLTEHTYGPKEGMKRPSALVYDLRWIAGHWKGSGLGGRSEEIWTKPAGNSMQGMYRLMRGETVVFYELMAIVQQDTSVTLLIKHFEPDLTGWEERNEVERFPLIKLTKEAAYFEGITFWRMGKKHMRIFLAMRQTGGEYKEAVFMYKRKKKC